MRSYCLHAVLLAAACVSTAAAQPVSVSCALQKGSDRQTVFISDLHLGPGHKPDGTWYEIEDFRWGDEFKLFLDRIDADGQGRTDLVLLGDSIELWQSVKKDCIYSDRNYGCSEDDALARLDQIVRAHGETLSNIGSFADRADNRVFVVPGNHDASLLFPRMQEALLKAIGSASPSRVKFQADGRWISADCQILAEHGHQIGREVNRFEGWPAPFLAATGRTYIRRPWGEQFVQKYYNAYEERYPIIDNILEEGVGIHYAMEAEGVLGTTGGVAQFVGFMMSKLSWAQFGGLLGGDQTSPQWDIAAIRAGGSNFFLESLPPGDPARPAIAAAIAAGEPDTSVEALSDAEIAAICDARASLQKVAIDKPRIVAAPQPCPAKKMGAVGQALLGKTRRARIVDYVAEVKRQLVATGGGSLGFALFVYGHTHSADSGYYVTREDGLPWRMRVLNTGAWQRVISPSDLEAFRCGRPKSEIITLQPDKLPAWYTAVVVKAYSRTPDARLRYWVKLPSGAWDFADAQPPVPKCAPGALPAPK